MKPSRFKSGTQLPKQSHALLRQGFLAADRIHSRFGRVAARMHIALRKACLDRVSRIRTENHRQFGRDLVNGGGRCRRTTMTRGCNAANSSASPGSRSKTPSAKSAARNA